MATLMSRPSLEPFPSPRELEARTAKPPGRLVSLDAYRGFVMLLMASGGLGIAATAAKVADGSSWKPFWQFLAHQVDHVEWTGCVLWDLIQPSFMFIVGVSMPYSYAARRERGQSWRQLFGHAVGRSLVLIGLGVFLASAWGPRTNFVFTNVLAQIGLGYVFVFLMLGRSPRVQASVAVAILVADWIMFVIHDVPGHSLFSNGFQLPTIHQLELHWMKNDNIAASFDRWFLNLFPRPDGNRFIYNEGGYATLNFIPSICTMLFGVMAGQWLRSPNTSTAKLQALGIVGTLGIVAGSLLDGNGCPLIKRIWTPSWVMLSTGWTCLFLAAFYGTIDVIGYRRWAFPLVVVGVNSIAMYLMAQLLKPWIVRQLQIHLGKHVFEIPVQGIDYGSIVQSLAVTGVLWLFCYWLYRQKIFLKI